MTDKFLGDQKASYGQTLRFKLRLGESGAIPRPDDLIIMSGGNRPIKISVSLTDQDNPVPSLSVNINCALIYLVEISNFRIWDTDLSKSLTH